MSWFAQILLLAFALATYDQKAVVGEVGTEQAPYLDLCKATNGDSILFDSRMANGRLTASFYRIGPNRQLQRLATFPDNQTANRPRTAEDPPEADHQMSQWGANMSGNRIASDYRVTFPMKTIEVLHASAQQTVGQDRLALRMGDTKWDAICDQLEPRGSEYNAFLKELGQ